MVEKNIIVLIGSTGQGKSSLGNFLLRNEKDHIYDANYQTFLTARTPKPETKVVKISDALVFEGNKYYIFDTPGLNEGYQEDIQHILGIIKQLVQPNIKIAGCLLCIKIDSKIDTQFQETVRYYSCLFRDIFITSNFAIVFTHSTCARRKTQERLNINPISSRDELTKAITQLADLIAPPMIFEIDSLPDPSVEKEWEFCCIRRKNILSYISKLDKLEIFDINLVKTPAWRQKDKQKIAELKGCMAGYSKKLEDTDKSSKDIYSKINKQMTINQEHKNKIILIEARLLQIDRKELADFHSIVVAEDWEFFEPIKKSMTQFSTKYPIFGIEKWTNGNSTWEVQWNKGTSMIGAKLKGDLWRGLYAKLTLKTETHLMHEVEIRNKKLELEIEKRHLLEGEQQLKDLKEGNLALTNEIKKLQNHIDENSTQILWFKKKSLSIEEADLLYRKLNSEQMSFNLVHKMLTDLKQKEKAHKMLTNPKQKEKITSKAEPTIGDCILFLSYLLMSIGVLLVGKHFLDPYFDVDYT